MIHSHHFMENACLWTLDPINDNNSKVKQGLNEHGYHINTERCNVESVQASFTANFEPNMCAFKVKNSPLSNYQDS